MQSAIKINLILLSLHPKFLNFNAMSGNSLTRRKLDRNDKTINEVGFNNKLLKKKLFSDSKNK